MEDKELKNLPPSYSNLGYDADSLAGPSAPKIESDPSPPYDIPGPSNAFPQHSAPLPDRDAPGPRTLVHNPPSLVFENIYDACVRHADSNCCYGKRFFNQMKLTDIHNKNVYHYRLESFVEKRDSSQSQTPYNDGPVDGPENGRPPGLWNMTVSSPEPFKDDWALKRIPHSESVHECPKCRGNGDVSCDNCNRSGEESCSSCSGSGTVGEDNDRCPSCYGSGEKRCSSCYGTGKKKCSTCNGYKRVMKYQTLRVTWKNHPTDSMTSTDQLPPELILKAQGVELLRESAKKLQPIRNAADPEVNSISALALQSHKRSFRKDSIIRQRHVLRAIPFTRVQYKWKEREGEFYIYGTEEKMYFEDYPQQYCCCTCC